MAFASPVAAEKLDCSETTGDGLTLFSLPWSEIIICNLLTSHNREPCNDLFRVNADNQYKYKGFFHTWQ